MKRMLSLFFVFASFALMAQETGYFHNPVIRGDVADPSMILVGDTYYATGTSSEWAPFYPLFASKDLVNWTQTGHVFDKQPEWTSHSFWAPELFAHNGKVYCYYTARRKSDNVSCIGVATAESPLHPFTDHGPIVEYGTEAIDAFVFEDNGQLYISWKAYGLDQRPIELLGSRLSADGLRLEGEPFTLMTDVEKIGMEGQYHFKQGDYYYIIYSARGCCGPQSDYDVRVARAESIEGPYEQYEGNPILHGGVGDYLSCGHGTVATASDGRMFYMCHGYLRGDGFFVGRQPIVQQMFMNAEGWPEFVTGRLAVAQQPLPFVGTVQQPSAGFTDNFDSPKLDVGWAWNYPYSDVHAQVEDGHLLLSGTTKADTRNGSVLCVRPQSPDYSFETQVVGGNESIKGLVMYGDDGNLTIWGIAGNRLLLKTVIDGKESLLYQAECAFDAPYLKAEVSAGRTLDFFFSGDGKQWTQVNDSSENTGSSVRWDRIARPGLIHVGPNEQPAEFGYFKLRNK